MHGMDATTSPTLLRCASARAGSSRRDGHCAPLLLDHGEGIPAASVDQSLHSLAPRNFFRWRHARAGARGILPAHLARAQTVKGISRLDGRALACARKRRHAVVVQFCLAESDVPPLPSLRENSKLARFCRGRLQAGTLESGRFLPEGGRYMNRNRVLTQTLPGLTCLPGVFSHRSRAAVCRPSRTLRYRESEI